MNSNIKTGSAVKLNEAALSRLNHTVQVPQYDRQQITNGIIHIGVGGFHRAHQALYLDSYFQKTADRQWGICGLGCWNLTGGCEMRWNLRTACTP